MKTRHRIAFGWKRLGLTSFALASFTLAGQPGAPAGTAA
jgi:hypothetical protein